MRISGSLAVLLSLASLLTWTGAAAYAGRIEAVRGKQYTITKRHGPWMIMVASFHEPPPERRDKSGEGLSPRQAANELVYELRRKGVPAYSFTQEDLIGQLDTNDRLGRRRVRKYTARHDGVTVLAGNYKSPQDRIAQRTLEWIKNFRPRFLNEVEATTAGFQKFRSGGLFRATPGQPGPLSGAHLTVNPLLSPQELEQRKRDPLLLRLNSDGDVSLLRNEGRYTLQVATFHGRKKKLVTETQPDSVLEEFTVSSSLDAAAQSAWELAKALRKLKKVEAWVFHDRYRSIVTVGSFDSPDDPRIAGLKRTFGAKSREMPAGSGRQVLLAEALTIPLRVTPGEQPEKSWMFDPSPQLIEVPRLR